MLFYLGPELVLDLFHSIEVDITDAKASKTIKTLNYLYMNQETKVFCQYVIIVNIWVCSFELAYLCHGSTAIINIWLFQCEDWLLTS